MPRAIAFRSCLIQPRRWAGCFASSPISRSLCCLPDLPIDDDFGAAFGFGANRPSGVRQRPAASVFAAPRAAPTSSSTPARARCRIAELEPGDEVIAADPATGAVSARTVSDRHINDDPVTGTVVIDGEPIATTPEHPFYTIGRGWLEAQQLVPGDAVRSADGTAGIVEALSWTAGPATMYNLTVEVDHTYFVGDGQWLVHNCGDAVGSGVRPGTGPLRDAGGRFMADPDRLVVGPSRRFSPDQDALVQLAKEAENHGVSRRDADILEGWRREYRLRGHPRRLTRSGQSTGFTSTLAR